MRLNDALRSLGSSSPHVSSGHSGEFSFVGGFGVGTNDSSRWIYVLSSVDDICGGQIGVIGSNKFCCKPAGSCSIGSHARRKLSDLIPGVYAKQSATELVSVPFVPADKISRELTLQMLEHDFESTQDVLRYFGLILEEGAEIMTLQELEEVQVDLKKVLFAKTPSKRRKVGRNVTFDGLVDQLFADEAMDGNQATASEVLTKLKNVSSIFGQALFEDESILQILNQKVNELFLQVGACPAGYKVPPNLWAAFCQLSDDIKYLKENSEDLSPQQQSYSGRMGSLSGLNSVEVSQLVAESERKILDRVEGVLATATRETNSLSREIQDVKGIAYGSGLDYGTITHLSVAMSKMKEMHDKLEARLDTIEATGGGGGGSGYSAGSKSVTFGQYRIRSRFR